MGYHVLVRQGGTRKLEVIYGPVCYSRNSGPLYIGALVPEVLVSPQKLQTGKLVLIQTHHLIQSN